MADEGGQPVSNLGFFDYRTENHHFDPDDRDSLSVTESYRVRI
jgi:hypothetical protein